MNKHFWIKQMPKYSMVIFIILNIVAMFNYPGGSINDESQLGYSFFNNFFSDLGMRYSHSNQDNLTSFLLFNFSLCVVGLCFSMLFYNIRNVFSNFKKTSLFASILGISSGLCYVGVAFTPADLLLDAHIVFAHYIFRLLFVASIIYAVLIFKTKQFDNKYAYGFVVFGLMVLSYVLFSEVYLSDPRLVPEHLFYHVVAQKMIAFWILIAIYIYSLGLSDYFQSQVNSSIK